MNEATRHTGRCFCGSVEIEVTGEPEVMGYCHCESCRRWAGAPLYAFTVWQPEGWVTPEGLELGAQAGDIGATYGELAEIDCGDYLALVDNAPTATSAYYVYEDEVWGFGLLERGRSPCV